MWVNEAASASPNDLCQLRLQLLPSDPANQQPAPILKDAFLNATLSLDYSYKSANKNLITSRPGSGTGMSIVSLNYFKGGES